MFWMAFLLCGEWLFPRSAISCRDSACINTMPHHWQTRLLFVSCAVKTGHHFCFLLRQQQWWYCSSCCLWRETLFYEGFCSEEIAFLFTVGNKWPEHSMCVYMVELMALREFINGDNCKSACSISYLYSQEKWWLVAKGLSVNIREFQDRVVII